MKKAEVKIYIEKAKEIGGEVTAHPWGSFTQYEIQFRRNHPSPFLRDHFMILIYDHNATKYSRAKVTHETFAWYKDDMDKSRSILNRAFEDAEKWNNEKS